MRDRSNSMPSSGSTAQAISGKTLSLIPGVVVFSIGNPRCFAGLSSPGYPYILGTPWKNLDCILNLHGSLMYWLQLENHDLPGKSIKPKRLLADSHRLTKRNYRRRRILQFMKASLLEKLVKSIACSLFALGTYTVLRGRRHSAETIVEGLGHMREALGEILEHIPTDNHTQREYAREFLRITADVNSGQGHSRR